MIILFGLAGSGKSTQGQIIAKKRGSRWLSIGQIIRNTGKFEKETRSGALINDDVAIDLMKTEIEKAEADGVDIVFDGFPRDEYQARWVAENIAEDIDCAIYLEVPKSELLERLKLRMREDDTEDSIKRRFAVVEQNIYSILSLLKAKNVPIKTVDGTGTVEEVTEKIEAVL